ncbi:MAG: hypothetical protein JWO13_388 [Acidobacteriales bacterium]|nr:hypothetical protein [Terriglobales bacterium]
MIGKKEEVLLSSGLWQFLPLPGLERFELIRVSSGWIVNGTILRIHNQSPIEVRYSVICNKHWETKHVEVSLLDKTLRTVTLEKKNGRWYSNERLQPSLDDCIDVDLEWSPSTNTIPIRRLKPPLGGSSGTVVAAWLRFPDLVLQPLSQEYCRTTERNYHYSSMENGFTAELAVDQNDVVVDYQGFWQRVGH